jgi:two-component system sensor histidine kinase DesK
MTRVAAPGPDREGASAGSRAGDRGRPSTEAEVHPARLIDRPGLRLPFIAATLFFTIYPLISLLSHEARPGVLALVLVGWAIFAVLLARLFRGGSYVHTVESPWIIAATVAILAIAVIAEVGFDVGDAGALFFYAGIAASRIAPERRALGWIGIVSLVAMLSTAYAAGDLGVGLDVGVTVGTISLTIFALSALGRSNRALQAARRELADLAVAEERNRIARDLHDTLGHSLSVIALKSELARRVLPADPARAADEMADVERVSREALASVRETVSGYRQPSLAIELAGARAALAAAGIAAEVEPAPEGLPRDVDAMLGWAVREGVTNVLRHSEARSARIRILGEPSSRGVEVTDDGRGTSEPDGSEALDRAGVGLAGLRERAARLGGTVEAGPLPDRGFRLLVAVPVGVAAEAR